MKKIVLSLIAAVAFAATSFAYNPPVQGENLFYLANPEMLSGGLSTAGGPLLSVTPSITTLNPALGALERRYTMELGYSAMFDAVGPDVYGQAYGIGIIFPTDWATFAGHFEGIFVPFYNMQLGKSLNFRTSASKRIMEKLYVGIGVGGGVFWGYDGDWMLTADVGAVYFWGDLAFFKNFRIGASVNNIGKVYTRADVVGVDYQKDTGWPTFPCFSTMRAGAAAELISTENVRLGISFDVTTPLFQNLIFDSGVQIEFKNFVKISSSWEFNSREAANNCNSWIPTIGVVFKFNIGSGFGQVAPSTAWKNVDGDINIFSVGAVVRLGELDTEGPDIEIY